MWNCGDHAIQSAADATIRNNIILSANANGIAMQPHQNGAPSNLEVVHNTILQATNRGISVTGVTGSVLIANNAVYAMGGSAIHVGSGSTELVTLAGNVGLGGLGGAASGGFCRAWALAVGLTMVVIRLLRGREMRGSRACGDVVHQALTAARTRRAPRCAVAAALAVVLLGAGACGPDREEAPAGSYEGSFFAETNGSRIGTGPSENTVVVTTWDGTELAIRIEVDQSARTIDGLEAAVVAMRLDPGIPTGEAVRIAGQALLTGTLGCPPTVEYTSESPTSPVISAAAWLEYSLCGLPADPTAQTLDGELVLSTRSSDAISRTLDLTVSPIHGPSESGEPGGDVHFFGGF